MYEKLEGGTVIDVQGLPCCIPPEGYVHNIITKKLEWRGVYERSEIKEEQYWERIPMPDWYKEVMKAWDDYDKKKKDDESEFYDERLEEFKRQEWDRRLNGFWYRNNGNAVYLAGMHYLYLQWWPIDIGYPKFRMPDLEKAYFLSYCIEDPLCMGMVEVTKRRFGKSFWAGLFVTEYTTRTKMTNGGIQSKTGNDAKKFFSKTVVNPFRRLPKFFRPEYDMSLGVNPKSEMRFQKTNVRGKKAEENVDRDELGSVIDWGSAEKVYYDGQKLHRYVADECGKCFGKGTKIRMWDGSAKNVEDISNGELVMGDDSSARLVYGKTSGIERMYRVVPNKGDGFVCNESHILSLSVSDRIHVNGVKYAVGDVLNISVKEYLNINPIYRKCLTIYRNGWELPSVDHKINPYMIGVWLGDGYSRDFSITSVDKEVIDSVYEFAESQLLGVRIKKDKISYHVTSRQVGVNKVTKELRRLNILNNKHIPNEYLIDSSENRLQLLAGLIDTDGHVSIRNGYAASIEIVQKNKRLAEGVKELATSLGFYTSISQRVASMKREDGSVYKCEVCKVYIYGQLDRIPCRIERKKPVISTRKNRRNPMKAGFKIEAIGEGEYFGFAVNGNHLFLLSDGTVVHNTTEVDVYERHEVVRYCLLDDEGKIIGKALYTTTVEKLDSDKSGVQDAFRLLWNESNQKDKRANGMTASGLYRFFMTAKKTRNFDLYGYPDEAKTEKAILDDREGVKGNPRALFARTRKEPLTIEEAFSIDADQCIFNAANIAKREKELEENPVFKRKVWFYRDELTQAVRWRDITAREKDFHWEIAQFPPPGSENKFIMDVVRKPGRVEDGAIAIDGYSNSQGGQKWGSRASAWIGRRYDLFNPEATGKAIGHIYGRPSEKDALHDQVLLAAEYYGYQAYYEHNSDDYDSYFKTRGRRAYLGLYPLISIKPEERQDAVRHKGVPTTPFSLTKQTDLGLSYFENYCHQIDWQCLLDDAKDFDPNDRTKSDITVSFLILLLALNEPFKKPPPQTTPLIKTYPAIANSQNN